MEKILYFKTPSVDGTTLTPVSGVTVKAVNIETQAVYIFTEIEQTGNYKADLPIGNYLIWDNSKGTMNQSGSLVVAGSIHNAFAFNTLPVGYEYMTVFQKTYDDLLASGRWVLQMGQQYPIATYSELYQIVGSCHSTAAEISAGNFRIADMRGVFMRFINQGNSGTWADQYGCEPDLFGNPYGESRLDGVKSYGASVANRAIGTKQYQIEPKHKHSMVACGTKMMNYNSSVDFNQTNETFVTISNGNVNYNTSSDSTRIIAEDNAPQNIALAPLIKILP